MVVALLPLVLGALGSSRLLGQTPPPRPAGDVQVWTSDVVSNALAPNAVKELKPVVLVGARNGTFSGKIVVESPSAIKGLQVAAGALVGSAGTIAAQHVQVRYAIKWETTGHGLPRGADILLESPPDVNVDEGRAVLPVWVSVKVPKDAKAGTYTGAVTVQPKGAAAVKVPVKLEVTDWTLPDPQDYRVWMDFVESPDTLAVEYKVPLWSEKHWKLIDRSFSLLNPSGARVLYVPLICRTNFGNEQSMVRWIPQGKRPV